MALARSGSSLRCAQAHEVMRFQLQTASEAGVKQHSNVGLQVALRCKCKLYCSERKRGVMECLDMPGEASTMRSIAAQASV